MEKKNQSLVDLLQTLPMSSFMVNRNALDNKEAQTLYDLWSSNNTDEYGRFIVGNNIDSNQIVSLTTKGYVLNHPSKYVTGRVPTRALELTGKAKEIIQKIILYKEKSSFSKSSSTIDYDAICRKANNIEKTEGKVASKLPRKTSNWLTKVL